MSRSPSQVRVQCHLAGVGLTLILLLFGGQAGFAQGGIDRSPLDFPVRIAGGEDVGAVSALTDRVTDTLFTWFISPTLLAIDSTRGYGVAVGIATSRLIPRLPLGFSISDRYITTGGEGQNRLQFDIQLSPILPIPRTSFLIQGHYRRTADVSNSQQGMMELDVSIMEKKSVALGVGGILYYGREAPTGGIDRSGATFGAAASVSVGRFAMAGEYDFESEFSGETDYSVQATYSLPVRRRLMGIRGLVGYGKHGVWIFGLKAAFLGPVRERAL
jgi:hypothetical protein